MRLQIAAITALLATLSISANAQIIIGPANVDFSFIGNEGSATGMISGTIFQTEFYSISGNVDDYVTTGVAINSAPSAFGLDLPFEFSNANITGGFGGLTIANGQVTNADLRLQTADAQIDFNVGAENDFIYDGLETYNFGEFAGVSYSVADVPEPKCLVLCFFGILALGVWKRHRTFSWRNDSQRRS